jgi:hypothetical protein
MMVSPAFLLMRVYMPVTPLNFRVYKVPLDLMGFILDVCLSVFAQLPAALSDTIKRNWPPFCASVSTYSRAVWFFDICYGRL